MFTQHMTIQLDKFKEASVSAGRSGLASEELLFMRTRLAAALEAHPQGNISRTAMLHVLDVDRITQAISYEWQTEEGSTIWPGMDSVSFDEAVKASSNRKMLHQRIKVWETVRMLVSDDGPELSGWIIRCDDQDGNAAVQLRWREEMKKGWADGIVITMDATFSNDLVAPYFDRPLEVLPADEPILPHVNVLQVVDRSFAATSVIPAGDNDDERRKSRAREVWRWIWLRSNQYRGKGSDGIDVLVVCQMGLEGILREWGIPSNVDIAHFNNIRGLDCWGGVRCLITIGRVSPKPSDVEIIKEALSGSAVTNKVDGDKWYPKQTVGIRLADGTGWPVENDKHPDPIAETVRHQICEGELVQAIGRGRAVNRTEGNPLQIDLLTNVCLPLTVDQPIRWEDSAPDKIDEMICRGLLPKSYSAAAQLYPDLWPSEDAARKAASRRRGVRGMEALRSDIPLIIYTIWGMSGLSSLFGLNLLPGLATISGNKRSQMLPFLFDPAIIPSPGSWLSDRLGTNVTVLIGADAEAALRGRKQ